MRLDGRGRPSQRMLFTTVPDSGFASPQHVKLQIRRWQLGIYPNGDRVVDPLNGRHRGAIIDPHEPPSTHRRDHAALPSALQPSTDCLAHASVRLQVKLE